MDSNEDGRCLPSMWTRRGEKLDFMDMCASPPADGFFYANNHKTKKAQQLKTTVVQDNWEVGQSISKAIEAKVSTEEQACVNSGFFKSFVPGYPGNSGGNASQGEQGFLVSGKILNMNHYELEKWAKDNIRHQRASPQDGISFDDSAPTPVDHLVTSRSTPLITKTDDGGSRSLIEKLSTTDVTPCTTPAVTPVCSPQVPRKSGNPFFTGDPSHKEDGSWLFRSAPKETASNMLYEEAKSITQSSKKNVRYVPRPSQLRELNFWCPTSM